jgi:zinc finger protein
VNTQILTEKEPVRYEMIVKAGEDLSIRIIRSMSASLEVPELGVRIDPGPACEGFISNVEGVLDRIEKIVKGALNWGNDEEQENARLLLDRIAEVKCGSFPITIILEDPSGNSAIVSDKAKKESYIPEPECGLE